MQKIEIIYQDENLIAVNKPAGMITFRQHQEEGVFLMDSLAEQCPELKNVGDSPRYGAVHRLDKDTSGALLVARHEKALKFLQEQFKARKVIKEYLALCVGRFKEKEGVIKTNIGRSPKDRRKQRAYPLYDPKNPRLAITRYKVLKNFEDYTKILAIPETGRKHQIRCHMAYIRNPIAGDSLYGFKNQPCPNNLKRHFLHAHQLRINTPGGYREFEAKIPVDLESVLENLSPLK